MNDDVKNELLLLCGELQIAYNMLSETLEKNATNKVAECIQYLSDIINGAAETVKFTEGKINDETD